MSPLLTHPHQGALIADAISMPVHWYYDCAALDRDYPDLTRFQAPLKHHPDSILWHSKYQPLNERGDILHDQAQFWGQRGIHYHQNLQAGENTVNFQLACELYQQVQQAGSYDPDKWLELYIEKMLTPSWHRDTYLEEYHRGFFTNLSKGKDPAKCGIKDEHIGGLTQVPALVAALQGHEREEVRTIVKTHVTLTHRHSNVLRAADCLVRLLFDIHEGKPLRQAIMQSAGDWFSTKKALGWEQRPDRTIIGTIISRACYIAEAFPAALYLAWKYHDDFRSAVVANAKVGGDNCHRGAVVGSLVSLSDPTGMESFSSPLSK